MDAKWFKHYVNMSKDPKFERLYRKHKEKFFPLYWMWNIVLESVARDKGWFRQGEGMAHDEYSLDVAFSWASDIYGREIIELFFKEFIELQIIEKDTKGFYFVKKWEQYQSMTVSTERVQKHRENEQVKALIDDIIIYLNQAVGKSFKTTTKSYREKIGARIKDGYTLDDFKAVINLKVAKWGRDIKMKQYLTPDTLFRPGHFDRYLNEIPNNLKSVPSADVLNVQDMYGNKVVITKSQYEKAESGFYTII